MEVARAHRVRVLRALCSLTRLLRCVLRAVRLSVYDCWCLVCAADVRTFCDDWEQAVSQSLKPPPT
eukprot:3840544-Pyramimonas_sp.AAC.1